jgi:hypothetical protein
MTDKWTKYFCLAKPKAKTNIQIKLMKNSLQNTYFYNWKHSISAPLASNIKLITDPYG